MTESIIVENLSYQHPGQNEEILKDISFKVSKGEVVAIVGLSGCGKSTLAYCISGIIPNIYKGTMKGKVLINGEDTKTLTLPQISTKLGIVFQYPDNQLFSPTVEDEIAFGPENLCLNRDEIEERISSSLKVVNMEKHRYSNPNRLSGGEKQLIAIASVLSLQPDILIFDEVMSQIDSEGKKRIRQLIISLKDMGKTIVMIEHDLNNLKEADRVYHLDKGLLREFKGFLS